MTIPIDIQAVALDAAEMGTWEWDPFTGRVAWNDNMFRLTGISPDAGDQAAKLLMAGTLEPDRHKVENTQAAQIASSNPNERFRYEFRFLRPDTGEIRCLASRACTVRGEDGNIHLAGVMFDITDFRKLQDDLEIADRAKSAMLATVAHELRSPLGAVLSAAYILEASPSHPPSEQLVQMLKRQGEHMMRIVEDLIESAQNQQLGQLSVGHDRVNVGKVVIRAIEVVEHLIVKKQHTLTMALPDQPVFVDGDSGRLLQVLTNLLQNAARYTPDGGKIHVCLTADDHHAFLEVEDNGPGIAPEVQGRLFDLFVQSKVSARQGGLGIGLSLVKQIVEAHHGAVDYCNARPQGTVFRVTLPRRHRENDPSPQSK